MSYYYILDIITAVTLLTLTFLVKENSRFDRTTKNKFYITYLCICVAMMAELFGLLLNGAPQWSIWLHRIVKCIDYCFTPIAGFMVIAQVSKRSKLQKFVYLTILTNILLQITSVFTGWTFYVTPDNYYYHGPVYFIYTLVYVITLLCVFIQFYQYGKSFRHQNLLSLLTIVLICAFGLIFQEILSFRVSYMALTIAASLLYIHYSEFEQIASDDTLNKQKILLETDVLTGLYNRFAYTNDVNSLEVEESLPDDLVVFSVDINELKSTNDTLGHHAGDELIKGTSTVLQNVLGKYGKCYRTGGDEFIAIVHIDAAFAEQLTLELQNAASNWHGKLVNHLTLSTGYALACNNPSIQIEKLIILADEKMYESKAQYYLQSGKSRQKNSTGKQGAINLLKQDYLDIISALASDVTGIYVIDRIRHEVTAYRISSSDYRIRSGVSLEQGFDTAMSYFIDKNVHPDDREMMRQSVQMEFIERELSKKISFLYHFRTVINGEIQYHFMKCIRNTKEDSYDKIIVSFSPEDNLAYRKRIQESIINSSKDTTILLVCTPSADSQLLYDILQQKHRCICINAGQQALKVLKEQHQTVSLVVYQSDMPDLPVEDFLFDIKNDRAISPIPVLIAGNINESQQQNWAESEIIDFIRPPYQSSIILNRVNNFIKMSDAINSLEEIEYDDLTGLMTKQAFFYRSQVLLDTSPDVSFTFIMSDVHNFKIFNEIYGVAKGDQLLKTIATYLNKLISKGIVARYGADQFIVMLASPQKERIVNEINKLQDFVHTSLNEAVELKFGVYMNVDRNLDTIRLSDRALMAVKSIKDNYDISYAMFDGPVSQQLLKAQHFESNFKKSIEKNEFIVWYQPKYDAYTNTIVGAEALVRWMQKDGTMIYPGEFLPVFETDGLISQLDEHVFRIVCAHQRKLKNAGMQLIPISVNLSRNCMHRTDVVQKYRAIVEEYDISPSLVPIEITESAAIGNVEIKPLADAFYESGFSLHMDDFGSGKSSIAGLNLLHFSTVKLDRSLIEFIGDTDGNLVLMYTVALGKELGLHIVAEGVETFEQVQYLKDIGCDEIQGYYFSKPVPEAVFDRMIAKNVPSSSSSFDKRYKLTAADSIVKRGMDRIIQRMPGGFFTYRADTKRILSSNPYLWHLLGCSSEDEFIEFVDGTFTGIVYPEDLELVEKHIAEQILHSECEMDYIEYRIQRKDGTIIPVVDYGHLDHQPDGDIFYVFIAESNHN